MRTSKHKLLTYCGGFGLVLKACQTFVTNKEETNLVVTDLGVTHFKLAIADRPSATDDLDVVIVDDAFFLIRKPDCFSRLQRGDL